MNPKQIAKWNAELRDQTPLEIVRWAIARANGRAVVSTNFRPYEAVLLHFCTQVEPEIPVLWVDHGYNRPATYKHAEELRARLKLNLKPYLPRLTAAHRDAIYGPIPSTDDEEGLIKPLAFVVLRAGTAGTPELATELKQFVRERLAEYKRPRWVEFLPELPKTATGKIQRFRLRELAAERQG